MSAAAAAIVSVGKHRVALGLGWTPLLNPGGDPRRKRAEAAEFMGPKQLKYAAIYHNVDKYFGAGIVGKATPGKAAGAVPGVTWLAEVVTEPTLVIMRLDGTDRFWVAAVIPKGISAVADELVLGTDVGKRIDTLLSNLGDDDVQIIVSPGASLPSTTMAERARQAKPEKVQTFAQLLAGEPPKEAGRVEQLVGVTPAMIGATAGAVFLAILAGGGWFAWSWYEQAEREKAMLAAQMAAAGQSADLQAVVEQRIRETVDAALATETATVSPTALIDLCGMHVESLPIVLGGWELRGASCTLQGVIARYGRDGRDTRLATNESLIAASAERGWLAEVGFGAQETTITLPANLVPRGALAADQLLAMSQAKVALPSLFQTLELVQGLKGEFGAPQPVPLTFEDPTPRQDGQPPVQTPVPPERSFQKGQVTASGDDWSFVDRLPLEQDFVTLTQIDLTPLPTGGFSFTATGTYVIGP